MMGSKMGKKHLSTAENEIGLSQNLPLREGGRACYKGERKKEPGVSRKKKKGNSGGVEDGD